MLYRFKSQVTADVLMLETNARHLLQVAGKQADATGIFTVEQIPATLSKIEAAIAEEAKSQHSSDAFAAEGNGSVADLNHVTLRQRAAPLIDMLKRSLAENKNVVWEV